MLHRKLFPFSKTSVEKITSRQRFVFVFLINLLLSCSHLNLNSNFPSKLMLRSQFCATISFSLQIPRSQTCVFLSFSLSSFLFFFISFRWRINLRKIIICRIDALLIICMHGAWPGWNFFRDDLPRFEHAF